MPSMHVGWQTRYIKLEKKRLSHDDSLHMLTQHNVEIGYQSLFQAGSCEGLGRDLGD